MALGNLKGAAFSVSITLALTSTPAAAWVAENVTPENFGPIEVLIFDLASDGCWTNLGEVRTYAEDKLTEIGFEVVESSAGKFIVRVHSERAGTDLCYGSINTSIGLAIPHNRMYGGLQVGEDGMIFANYRNANTITLNWVKKHIEQMEDVELTE